MNPHKSRFFIALLPPQEVQESINKIKQHFAEVYNSKKAFNAPPHITLQPPFEWENHNLSLLYQTLETFALTVQAIPITLSGFGAFKPRVIYIHPEKTPQLLTVQKTLRDYLQQTLGLQGEKRSFNPHVTVAFRDLTKGNFKRAWTHFEQQPFRAEFIVSHLTLLQHNGFKWTVDRVFSFSPQT